jgi:hypothetical protein
MKTIWEAMLCHYHCDATIELLHLCYYGSSTVATIPTSKGVVKSPIAVNLSKDGRV